MRFMKTRTVCVALFVTLVAILMVATYTDASYIDVVPDNDTSIIRAVNRGDEVRIVEWVHTLEGYGECDGQMVGDYGLAEQGNGPVWVGLIIWADDVDFKGLPLLGGDETFVRISDGLRSLDLGALEPWSGGITGDGYTSGRGQGKISVTVFDSDAIPGLLTLNYGDPITVTVSVLSGWEVEIESSQLEVRCAAVPIPTSVWLLGSGLICLVGVSRKLTTKKGQHHS